MKTALVTALLLISASGLAADVPTVAPTEQLLIPAGEFIMGRAESSEELTPHPVKLSAFHIDKHEVTNAQYHAFCVATEHDLPVFWGLDRFRCSLDFPDHPVVGVSQAEAAKYAEWVGRRLPTEAEWEYAARGGLASLSYDTGDVLEDQGANTKSAKLGGPVAVGSFEPNAYGLYDMVGNVREWVADYYAEDYFANSPVDNPQGPEKTRWMVIKGGGWYSGKSCNMVHVRNALPRSWSDFNVGFRCASDAD
jgi:formylglycine-generating enzyme required for sulfatase activity